MQFRISAKLCALGVSAVLDFQPTFTAKTQRTRRQRREQTKLHHYAERG